jgi:hypothetical protein
MDGTTVDNAWQRLEPAIAFIAVFLFFLFLSFLQPTNITNRASTWQSRSDVQLYANTELLARIAQRIVRKFDWWTDLLLVMVRRSMTCLRCNKQTCRVCRRTTR